MIRPDFVGKKIIFEKPNKLMTTTSINAAVDSTIANADIYPQAYTETVNDNFDERIVLTDGACNIATGNKLAFGLFLSPENEKNGLMFNVSGGVFTRSGSGSVGITFFFGRQAGTTVTSSTGTPENQMEDYIVLGCEEGGYTNHRSVKLNEQIFAKRVGDGGNFVFGVLIRNLAGSDDQLYLDLYLSFQKFGQNIDCFRPDRS